MPTDSTQVHLLGHNYRCRLYLADDHLLAVLPENMFWEKCLRLRYADISAVSLQTCPHRRLAAILSALLLALAFLCLKVSADQLEIAIATLLMPAGILAALMLKYCLDQPNCRMTVHTLTHSYPLPFPHTLRQANRLLPRLRERLRQAQPDGETPSATMAPAPIPPRKMAETHPAPGPQATRADLLTLLFFLSIPVSLPVNLASDSLVLPFLVLLPSCYLGLLLVLTSRHQSRPLYALICLLTTLQILQLPGIFALSSEGTEYLQLVFNLLAPTRLFSLHRLIVYLQTLSPFLATPFALAGLLLRNRQRRRQAETPRA